MFNKSNQTIVITNSNTVKHSLDICKLGMVREWNDNKELIKKVYDISFDKEVKIFTGRVKLQKKDLFVTCYDNELTNDSEWTLD